MKTAPRARTHARPKTRVQRRTTTEHFVSAYAWAHSTAGIKVANCESGDRHTWTHYNGNPYLHDGPYTRKWQIGASEWRGAGGSGYAWQASESEQDYRAWVIWKARGWQPWSCARIMGV